MKKYDEVMMKTAQLWAEMSYCKRAKVGAVISKNSRPISVGYNGTISGCDNNCEDENNKTKIEVQHAERNALDFASKNGLALNGCTLYVTISPCLECSKSIVTCGIKEVVYLNEYRDKRGIQFLKECSVEVRKYEGK